jgi:hypothetical protein
MGKFKSTSNKGFQLTFDNGLTISVQWGIDNYCERRYYFNAPEAMSVKWVESTTAEIAIWDGSDGWFDFGNDVVKGYVEADEVAEWIIKTSKVDNLSELYKL